MIHEIGMACGFAGLARAILRYPFCWIDITLLGVGVLLMFV